MELPRFEPATRRAVLRQGLAATGAVTAVGLVLAACRASDADTFAAATPDSASAAPTTGPTATVAPPSSSVTPAPTTSSEAVAAAPIDIAFSYTAADSSGRVRNPYVAVWIEDGAGEMAALVGVWYSTREAKYLRELTDFTTAASTVSSAQLAAVSGATRAAGQYQLRWDGIGLDGAALGGPFTLWVEAAREHGPHSVTSGLLQLGPAIATTIAGAGELSDVVVTVG